MVTGLPAGGAVGAARALAAALDGVETRVGIGCVMVASASPDAALRDRVRRLVRRLGPDEYTADARVAATVVPVSYTGADLAQVAGDLGCTPAEVAAAHARQHWRVAMMGFAPGFGYLVPIGEPVLDWSRLPRRERPRTRVPAGSVGVAAGMSAVYPAAMPGGWHLLGTTDITVFDAADEARPALLRPGDVVRFEAVVEAAR